MNTADSKRDLRHSLLAQLRAMPAELRNLRSATLRQQLAPYLDTPEPLNIALYAPLPHEVDLMPLLQEYPQHRYGFPRCGKQGYMAFHHVTKADAQLTPGALGILAPLPELPIIPAQEMHVVIVPGVGFTEDGLRLGYGGGFYDRYLPQCPQARIVAAAFPEQICTTLPTEEHDLRIPHIIIA